MSDPLTDELRLLLASPLSRTERERILPRLLRGMSNDQISRELGVSIRTVKWHVTQINNKLQVSSRSEVVYLALLLGLVHLDDDKGAALLRLRERLPGNGRKVEQE